METVKMVRKWGNSSGVLLPKEWEDKEVKIILIDRSLEIRKEVFDILSDYLEDILGIYLVGSYARNEQAKGSDVDILAITNKTDKRIKRGKYEIICITKKEIEAQLKENALPILPMIKEAKTIINQELIKDYQSSQLTRKNLRYHIETTKSAMKVVKKEIELAKEIKEDVSDASAYSLILRLRTLYIIGCIRKNKMWSRKDFLKLVKSISGSVSAYERYLSAKNKNTLEYKLPIKEAEKLMSYINKEVELLKKNLV